VRALGRSTPERIGSDQTILATDGHGFTRIELLGAKSDQGEPNGVGRDMPLLGLESVSACSSVVSFESSLLSHLDYGLIFPPVFTRWQTTR